MSCKDYFHLPAITAGFVSVLVGFTSSAVIVFRAASTAIAGLFAAFPTEFVLALAGLALLNTIAGSLSTAVSDTSTREASEVTFLVAASGITLMGIRSAF